MKNLKNLKKLADMHFAQYENVMAVIAAETEKADTRNYTDKVRWAAISADKAQEYENVDTDMYRFNSQLDPFEDTECGNINRHITMVERFQIGKASGMICSPIIEDIECVMHED